MKHQYMTSGTCSRMIEFEITPEKTITNVTFAGGCNGNLQGIAALVDGMKAEDVVERLRNIRCGNKATSCPHQLACAIEQTLNS